MANCCDHDHTSASADSHRNCCTSNLVQLDAANTDTGGSGQRSTVYIQQMCCAAEAGLIRDTLTRLPEVLRLEFNLVQRLLTIEHAHDGLQPALEAIRKLGFTPQTDRQRQQAEAPASANTLWSGRLLLATAGALLAEVLHFAAITPRWLVALLALGAVLSAGLEVYRQGWIALKNLNLNINALMSIAVTGAFIIGQWPEAAMVMVLFTLAERIEDRSLERARNAIHGLLALSPQQATVRQQDGSWQVQEVAQVAIGSRVRLRPGERVGLDGVVLEGHSSLDQSPITGESLPVEKGVGDNLFAGTINQSGSLEYQVSAAASNSTLSRIIKAVEQAQSARAPTQRFVDRFARLYTPLVFLLSLGVALLPPLLLSGNWLDWLYRALVLLVVSCPCALVISTPVTIVSGLAAAARKGILIKGGVYLEKGRTLTHLALDKTGTLTHGKPLQTDFQALERDDGQQLRRLAVSLALRSDHPISRAIARAAQEEGLSGQEVEDFRALPGRGISGLIEGRRYHLGNHQLLADLGLYQASLEALREPLERQGKSVVLLCDEQRALALFAVADTLKDSSRQAIEHLQALGIKTLMLTGDNSHTGHKIANEVGIEHVFADLLPTDKLTIIEQLTRQQRTVGMVGDGINDTPALARADIGFAMAAAGTDSAIETADVAIMDDDLRKIPTFVRLSRQTSNILKQNIAFALVIKAVFMAMTLAGQASMWMAVFADMGVSLLVVLNGLRMLRK
jgi:Cd2+/Zn2+-exporting ATPase